MARLAAVSPADPGRRVRCSSTRLSDVTCFAESFRIFPSQGAYSPFVLGPLNGGLPWPTGFSQLENQKEWVWNLWSLYRYLPFVRSTYRHATAIIGASSQVCSEFAQYSDKVSFVPEPGISRFQCLSDKRTLDTGAMLGIIFVG